MQTLDQISMKFETWAIFMSLYGMVCQKDIGSISPYPRGISANPFKAKIKRWCVSRGAYAFGFIR